ncbi:MAG: hypothetical protein ACREJM_07550, partial [Candidatus Saccharimonadales bacterium]
MVGNTPLVAQPMVVGALVDRLGFSERQAGLVAAAQLFGLTIGILAMMPAVGRIRRSTLAFFAVAIIMTANVFTCLVRTFEPIVVLQLLSWVGAAAAFCVFTSMAAADRHPENAFAIVNAISIAYSGVVNLLAPTLLAREGLAGILLGLSFVAMLALTTLPWLRTWAGPSAGPTQRGSWIFPAPAAVLPLLAMMLVLYTGHGAIWGYQERIGIEAGLSES